MFPQLQVWTPAADGSQQLVGLTEAGVGAILQARVGTPFDLKNSANTQLGQVRASGVYLADDGRAGTVQQIDLAV